MSSRDGWDSSKKVRSVARGTWIKRSRVGFAAMLSALLMLAGCGYPFASAGSGLAQDAKTIYVSPFSNASRFTGFNAQFMRYMNDHIAEHKRLQIVDEPKQADLLLTSQIL